MTDGLTFPGFEPEGGSDRHWTACEQLGLAPTGEFGGWMLLDVDGCPMPGSSRAKGRAHRLCEACMRVSDGELDIDALARLWLVAP